MRQTDFSTVITCPEREAMVVVRGELDLATEPPFRAELMGCLTRRYPRIGVDMQAVRFMDCSGLRVLLACRNAALESGATISVRRASRCVRRLLSLTDTEVLLAI